MPPAPHRPTRKRLTAIAASATLAVGLFGAAGSAHAASISGKWSGGGVVNLSSGGKERVRCAVTYGRIAGSDFSVNARCSSGAGRVDQTGTLRRISANKYVGTVKNVQYSVTATVTVNVSASGRQNVSIASSKGTANLSLVRRK